ncbi:Calcium-dependent protein kinase 17 [Cymbomonas tetramitiformis]|nr:Calcium-dependent protein kinase 17 [Cymbomonas tetramitiformis]
MESDFKLPPKYRRYCPNFPPLGDVAEMTADSKLPPKYRRYCPHFPPAEERWPKETSRIEGQLSSVQQGRSRSRAKSMRLEPGVLRSRSRSNKMNNAPVTDTYDLTKVLGRGCYGVIRLATHRVTGEKFACKTISKARARRSMGTGHGLRVFSAAPDGRQKTSMEHVRREISILYHLQGHPNVIKLEERFEDEDSVHLIMELCSGGELFEQLMLNGVYSEMDAASIIRTILKVAAQCHALGVIHRDLKLENFLLSSSGPDAQLKAIDFGLSTFFQPSDGPLSETVGSAYYMAPEVLSQSYGYPADIWSIGVILYILLSGEPPFNGSSTEEILTAVSSGAYSLQSGAWDRVSKGAKELVHAMLAFNPDTRITAAEALIHDWVRENGDASNELLGDSVFLRLRKYAESNRLKQVALQVVVNNMVEEEIEGLAKLFKSFDSDGDGVISSEEWCEGFENMAKQGTVTLTEEQVTQLMAAADLNGDGKVSYKEFIAATIQLSRLETDEHLLAAFETFDQDNSGYIDREEVQSALGQYGSNFEGMDELFTLIDQDNNGKIDYEEFAQMMRTGLEEAPQPVIPPSKKLGLSVRIR